MWNGLAFRYDVIRVDALSRHESLNHDQGDDAEMDDLTQELPNAQWRKSTLSGSDGSNCVEVADLSGGRRAVRDSKDRTGPALVFTPGRTGRLRQRCEERRVRLTHDVHAPRGSDAQARARQCHYQRRSQP